MCMPISTAEAGRGFSLMQRIKNYFRSSLSSNTLAALMRIKLNGPVVADFNPEHAINMWYSSGKRKITSVYGPRKQKQNQSNQHSDSSEAGEENDPDQDTHSA